MMNQNESHSNGHSLSPYRMISYLIAANTEAIALIVGAWWIGEWLNENYARGFTWYAVTFPLAGIVIAHSWYMIFRVITKKSGD